MKFLYEKPGKVYALMALIALVGIWSGLNLPVALFPTASRPVIWITIPYSQLDADAFRNKYGLTLETSLRSIATKAASVDWVTADYGADSVDFGATFQWGSDPKEAEREACAAFNVIKSQLSPDAGRRASCENFRSDGGYLIVSFFAPGREPKEVYRLLKAPIEARLSRVKEAEHAQLFQPEEQAVGVNLDPYRLAQHGLLATDVYGSVEQAVRGLQGGSLFLSGRRSDVEMPPMAGTVPSLEHLLITAPNGAKLPLNSLASVAIQPRMNGAEIFRTSGERSLLLYATPRSGANVKKMAEDILREVQDVMTTMPKDVRYNVLVNPAEFIGSATVNVLREVLIGSLFAVAVLFLFIGSLRNVITAAIEIPLSMVLAFIMMRLTGVSINLISLGGLALSAGMNVDGSVVVMENIFRHCRERKDGDDLTNTVLAAVKEIAVPLLTSTLASVIVFLPLAFTANLSAALLGDLAKTVIYSHTSSAVVALILVPTVRLHLLRHGGKQVEGSKIEPLLHRLELGTERLLRFFHRHRLSRVLVFGGVFLALPAVAFFAATKLPCELLANPDTDWLTIRVSSTSNETGLQMDAEVSPIEKRVRADLGPLMRYTFSQVWSPMDGVISVRLSDKRQADIVMKRLAAICKDSDRQHFVIKPWNPSEFHLPKADDLRVVIRGSERDAVGLALVSLKNELEKSKVYGRVSSDPEGKMRDVLRLTPNNEAWAYLREKEPRLTPASIIDLLSLVPTSRYVGDMQIDGESLPVEVQAGSDLARSPMLVDEWPLPVAGKIVPLKALVAFSTRQTPPPAHYKNGQLLAEVYGNLDPGSGETRATALAKIKPVIDAWQASRDASHHDQVTVAIEDGEPELTDTLNQLRTAGAWSLLLILMMLYLQFGKFAEATTVMLAMVFGLCGAVLSLAVFGSKLSINAALGMILLNALAVANSILLVECAGQLWRDGMAPLDAVCAATRMRLRPILITSLTTILGMLPVALGTGDGGRVLQPLGIAVAGGLFVSAFLTVLIVPLVHLSWLERRTKGGGYAGEIGLKSGVVLLLALVVASALPTRAMAAPLDFYAAVDQVVASDKDLASRLETLAAANSRQSAALFHFFPDLSFTQAGQAGNPYDTPGVPAFGYNTYTTTALNAQWNLFRSGVDVSEHNWRGTAANKLASDAANARLKAEVDAARLLLAWLAADYRVALLQHMSASAKQSLTVATAQMQRDQLRKHDWQRTQADLLEVDARLDTALADRATQAAALGQRLDPTRMEHAWPFTALFSPPIDLASAVARNTADHDLAAHPQLQAAVLAVTTAEQQSHGAYAKLGPSLDAGYTVGRVRSYVPRAGFVNQTSATMTLTVPLLASAGYYEEARALAHERAAADLQAQDTRRILTEQLSSATQELLGDASQLHSTEAAVTAAREVFEESERLFAAARTTASELGLDERQAVQAELGAIVLREKAQESVASYCAASGQSLRACVAELRRTKTI